MVSINTVLGDQGGPIWKSEGIFSAERSNANGTAGSTQIAVIAGTKMMRISPETNVDFTVWITEQGVVDSDIVKANGEPGGITVNGTLQEGIDIWFDDSDPPLVFFGEIGSSDLTVHVTFYR